jgi:hypothetical protein
VPLTVDLVSLPPAKGAVFGTRWADDGEPLREEVLPKDVAYRIEAASK